MRKFVFILSLLCIISLSPADIFPAAENDLNSIPATADSTAGMWANPAAAGLPRGFHLGAILWWAHRGKACGISTWVGFWAGWAGGNTTVIAM